MAARSTALCRPQETGHKLNLPSSFHGEGGIHSYEHTDLVPAKKRQRCPWGLMLPRKQTLQNKGKAIIHLAALFTLTQWIHSVTSWSRLDYDSYTP